MKTEKRSDLPLWKPLYVRPRRFGPFGTNDYKLSFRQVSDFAHESKSIKAHVFQCSYSGKHC